MSGGRPKKPIALHLAEGNPSHLTKGEIEERIEGEVRVPFTDVEPPECLTTKKQIDEFNDIAEKLVALGIFTELDVDALARYILSKELYLTYTNKLKAMLKHKDADLRDISTLQQLQDKAHRQCVTGANELCLNVASRARLVIPKPPEKDEELW